MPRSCPRVHVGTEVICTHKCGADGEGGGRGSDAGRVGLEEWEGRGPCHGHLRQRGREVRPTVPGKCPSSFQDKFQFSRLSE